MTNRNLQLVGKPHEGADRKILHPELDALQVIGRDRELLGELLLREPALSPQLRDLATDVLDDSVSVELRHLPTLRCCALSKHCNV